MYRVRGFLESYLYRVHQLLLNIATIRYNSCRIPNLGSSPIYFDLNSEYKSTLYGFLSKCHWITSYNCHNMYLNFLGTLINYLSAMQLAAELKYLTIYFLYWNFRWKTWFAILFSRVLFSSMGKVISYFYMEYKRVSSNFSTSRAYFKSN